MQSHSLRTSVTPCLCDRLHQTFALAIIGHHDQLHFGIHLALAIPVAACCANLDLSRQDQFFSHLVPDENPYCRCG